jgi:lipid-A-disaccharide synthase
LPLPSPKSEPARTTETPFRVSLFPFPVSRFAFRFLGVIRDLCGLCVLRGCLAFGFLQFSSAFICDNLRLMRFLISAGEASGDLYGAQLIAALQRHLPEAQFFGVGGAAMRDAGCDVTLEARDIAVVGLAEVVTHLPKIYGEFRRLVREVDTRRPDAAILIDFPDFNFRLAQKLHERGIPVFYYISPQLWAWRSGRIKLVRNFVRKMLVIFPFEEQWYAERGVDVAYVGHPLADLPQPAMTRAEFADEYGFDTSKQWIGLLPGSRRKEVLLNLPEMLSAAAILNAEGKYQLALPVASTLDREWLRQQIERAALPRLAPQIQGREPGAPGVPAITLTGDARATLLHSRAAIVASGTATVEAALLGTPFVMIYRVAPLSWKLGRKLVKVPHYGMVNLILGRRAVPELVQHDFSGEKVATALAELIADGPARQSQLAAFCELRQKLHPAERQTAAERAAEVIASSIAEG